MATFTMVASSRIMKAPASTTASASQRPRSSPAEAVGAAGIVPALLG